MWELDYKESWVVKNGCYWTVVLEKTFESPLDCKEIQPVHPKGDQSWVFIGRSDVEDATPILWPPDVKRWLMKRPWWRRRRRRRQKMRLLDGITNSVYMSLGKFWSWWWTGSPGMLWFMGSQRDRHDWVTVLDGADETETDSQIYRTDLWLPKESWEREELGVWD